MFGFLVAGMIRWVFNHYKPCFDVLATVATAEIGIAGKLGPCYPVGPWSCGWFQLKSKRSILILLKDALLVKVYALRFVEIAIRTVTSCSQH